MEDQWATAILRQEKVNIVFRGFKIKKQPNFQKSDGILKQWFLKNFHDTVSKKTKINFFQVFFPLIYLRIKFVFMSQQYIMYLTRSFNKSFESCCGYLVSSVRTCFVSQLLQVRLDVKALYARVWSAAHRIFPRSVLLVTLGRFFLEENLNNIYKVPCRLQWTRK